MSPVICALGIFLVCLGIITMFVARDRALYIIYIIEYGKDPVATKIVWNSGGLESYRKIQKLTLKIGVVLIVFGLSLVFLPVFSFMFISGQ